MKNEISYRAGYGMARKENIYEGISRKLLTDMFFLSGSRKWTCYLTFNF